MNEQAVNRPFDSFLLIVDDDAAGKRPPIEEGEGVCGGAGTFVHEPNSSDSRSRVG
jgi:hypothetical protein